MNILSLLSVFFLLSIHNADAFASVNRATAKTFALQAQSNDSIPDHDDSMLFSRRNAMRQGATAAMLSLSVASVLTTPDVALADIYDDQEKERKLKAKEKAEGGKKLIPTVLFGGFALSLPFFLPNLLRLGKKLFS